MLSSVIPLKCGHIKKMGKHVGCPGMWNIQVLVFSKKTQVSEIASQNISFC